MLNGFQFQQNRKWGHVPLGSGQCSSTYTRFLSCQWKPQWQRILRRYESLQGMGTRAHSAGKVVLPKTDTALTQNFISHNPVPLAGAWRRCDLIIQQRKNYRTNSFIITHIHNIIFIHANSQTCLRGWSYKRAEPTALREHLVWRQYKYPALCLHTQTYCHTQTHCHKVSY